MVRSEEDRRASEIRRAQEANKREQEKYYREQERYQKDIQEHQKALREPCSSCSGQRRKRCGYCNVHILFIYLLV
jgi:hypothetical protein